MPEPAKNSTRRELAIAVALAAAWAAIGLMLSALLSTPAHGAGAQNPPPLQGGVRGGIGDAFSSHTDDAANEPLTQPLPSGERGQRASCRVYNHLPNGSVNVGSGTLIDVSDDGRNGLVLSCAHLWSEGAGQVIAEFADGRTHGARVVALDREADLAAIEIANPRQAPAQVSQLQPSATVTACGFGPTGSYRCVTGTVIGEAQGPGQVSAKIAGAVRSGDSGGGVFDASGRLVAVVWGESEGVTYASTGGPLQRFLDRVLPRRRPIASAQPRAQSPVCPNGRCPLMGPANSGGPATIDAPLIGNAGSDESRPNCAGGTVGGAWESCNCECGSRLAEYERRLDLLQQNKQDRGNYVVRADLSAYARSEAVAEIDRENQDRHQSLLERLGGLAPSIGVGRSLGAAAATALGISGPAGWGILAAASVGGWLIGRRLKRKMRGPTRSEATAAAEQAFRQAGPVVDERQPIERDDRETRQLLRLSQLEGRDPLQDALAGRIAIDRLDAAAESDVDPQHAKWADGLRRQLRERFNEIAPTRFQTNGECGMGNGG